MEEPEAIYVYDSSQSSWLDPYYYRKNIYSKISYQLSHFRNKWGTLTLFTTPSPLLCPRLLPTEGLHNDSLELE